jgi:hypothetical protein
MLDPGRYALSLTPVTQGRNTVHVCWAGMNVKGSPFQLKAQPAPPHASAYKLAYKPRGWPELVAGTKFKVRLQAHDRFGNIYTSGCAQPRVWLRGADEATTTAGPASRVVPALKLPAVGRDSSSAAGSALDLTDVGKGRSAGGIVAGDGGGDLDDCSDASPRWATPAETFPTRLRSQLLSDFGLGLGGNPLPEAWKRLIAEADSLHTALEALPAQLRPEVCNGSAISTAGPTHAAAGKSRANLALLGAALEDPSVSLEANLAGGNNRRGGREQLVPLEQRYTLCEVVDISRGLYEIYGTPLRSGTYKLCLQLPPFPSPAGEALVAETAEATAAAAEEAEGVICDDVRVVAGAVHPPACTLGGEGLQIAHEGEPAFFELVAIDRHGNAAESGGEKIELIAHKLLPAGSRKLFPLEYTIDDCGDGRYSVQYMADCAGRIELSLVLLDESEEAQVQQRHHALSPPSAAGRAVPAPGAMPVATLIGGRSFMVIVRPALAKDLSPLEAAAAMEAHARMEVALACEAVKVPRAADAGGKDVGDGITTAVAGEEVAFIVRLPPKPLRSPERKVVRRGTRGGEDVVSGKHSGAPGGRVGSWSAAEHLVLDKAKLTVSGAVERQAGSGDMRQDIVDFALDSVCDNGDGTFTVAYTAAIAGKLTLCVELAGGGHIGGSPFHVAVLANDLVPANSYASGAGLFQCEVGVACHFDVFACDKWSNPRPFDPEEVSVSVLRASGGAIWGEPFATTSAVGSTRGGGRTPIDDGVHAAATSLAAGPNGGCRATYTLLEPGPYLVHVATGKGGASQPLRGSPFSLNCGAGPIELSCCTMLEVGVGGEPLGRVLSTGGGRVWVQTRDQLANARSTPCTQDLWCELRPKGSGGGAAVEGTCTDLGDGRIEVSYPPSTPAGLLDVWLGLAIPTEDGVQSARVPGKEHKLGLVRMERAIRFGDESLVTVSGALKVRPGELFDILVSSVDDAGRQMQKGGEQLRAQLATGPAPVALEVYDNGDGSYRVSTAVQVSGEYRIAFYVNGMPVAGSPITLIAPRTSGAAGISPRTGMGGRVTPTASPMTSARGAGSPRRGRLDSPRAASPRAASPRAASARGGRASASTGTSRAHIGLPPKAGSAPRMPSASALPAAAAATRGYARVLGEMN